MRITDEYNEALKAYDKLYKVDKLRFLMNNLDILNKSSLHLKDVNEGINQLLKDMTQLDLYKDLKEIYK